MYFKNGELRVGKAFYRQPVARRPTAHDGLWDVYFCHKAVAWIDLTSETGACHRRKRLHYDSTQSRCSFGIAHACWIRPNSPISPPQHFRQKKRNPPQVRNCRPDNELKRFHPTSLATKMCVPRLTGLTRINALRCCSVHQGLRHLFM